MVYPYKAVIKNGNACQRWENVGHCAKFIEQYE